MCVRSLLFKSFSPIKAVRLSGYRKVLFSLAVGTYKCQSLRVRVCDGSRSVHDQTVSGQSLRAWTVDEISSLTCRAFASEGYPSPLKKSSGPFILRTHKKKCNFYPFQCSKLDCTQAGGRHPQTKFWMGPNSAAASAMHCYA